MDLVKKIRSLNPSDFTEICRICLSSEGLELVSQTLVENIEATDLYEYTIGVQFERIQMMPPNICDKCLITLYDMYKLKKQCLVNERLFRLRLDINQKLKTGLHSAKQDIADKSEEQAIAVPDELGHCKLELKCEDNSLEDVETEDSTQKALNAIALENTTLCKTSTVTTHTEGKNQNVAPRLKGGLASIFGGRDNSKIPCPECGKLVHNRGLASHSETHSLKRKIFKCDECDRVFKWKATLKRHQMQHVDGFPFKCTDCNRGFKSRAKFKYHLPLCNKEQPNEKKEFVCKICSKVLFLRHTFRRHLKFHVLRHEANEEDIANEIKGCPFTCEQCSQLFDTETRLKIHIKLNHTAKDLFLCTVCGKNLTTNTGLQLHLKTHTGEKPFTCGVCHQSFTTLNTFKRHSVIHTDERPFKCHICLKRFKLAVLLNKHLYLHNGVKPYKCHFCDKSFAFTGNLKKHIAGHTGELRYFCSVCKKGFYDLTILKTHELKHETKQAEADI